ncbi:acetamidase/formamidase family protein [Brenneria goodwinii]|uniref:acetamidase/formamidase family protein n=1 Tax=Brenneria goodwinii TaxID=1109412 RepID=UPI0036E16097
MSLIKPEAERLQSDLPPRTHVLKASPETVHWGYFDAGLDPKLTIDSGDIVCAEAVTQHAGDAPELMMDDEIGSIYRDVPVADRTPGVHIMTGPIFVRDAQPGDMLEVRYLLMKPRFMYGSNLAAHWGHLYQEMGEKERVTIYKMDEFSQTATPIFAYDFPGAGKYEVPGTVTAACDCCRAEVKDGIRVPVRPHLGTAGVAPNVPGRVSTVPPGEHGGNIDNWRIGAGATMYYPVQVPGALFSIGDPHISQGDGEISGTAIEASLNVIMQIKVRKDFHFPSPLLETADFFITHGFNEDLDLAMRQASINMLSLLTDHFGMTLDDAYSLMSVAVDFSVTQVVDGRQGVHAKISRTLLKERVA